MASHILLYKGRIFWIFWNDWLNIQLYHIGLQICQNMSFHILAFLNWTIACRILMSTIYIIYCIYPQQRTTSYQLLSAIWMVFHLRYLSFEAERRQEHWCKLFQHVEALNSDPLLILQISKANAKWFPLLILHIRQFPCKWNRVSKKSTKSTTSPFQFYLNI